jgi:hypothetical protein
MREESEKDGELTGLLGNRQAVGHRFDHPHQSYSYGRKEEAKKKELHMCFLGFLKMIESTESAHKRIKLLLESTGSVHRKIKLSKSTRVNPGLIPKKKSKL